MSLILAIDQGTTSTRAIAFEVRDHDGLVRIQQLRRLGHEVDATERDHVAVGALGGLRQGQRVADDVGEILNLGFLVVVSQQESAALPFQIEDGLLEVVGEVFGTVVRVIRSAHHPLQGVAFLISIRMLGLAHKSRIAQ